MIRKMNDFVLSLIMIVLSLFLMFGEVTQGGSSLGQGGILSEADTYLKFIAFLLLVVSAIMFFRSFDFKRSGEKESFKFSMTILVALVALYLVIYTLVLPIIGFEISTFVLAFLLCFSFGVKEDDIALKDADFKVIGPILLRSLVFSILMVIALYLIFGKLLQIQLP